MTIIDALGQPCPIPVVLTKKAITALPPGGGVQVLVDNIVACENLAKMAKGMNVGYSMQEEAAQRFRVTITVGVNPIPQNLPHPDVKKSPADCRDGLVVAIGRNSMGHGSEELGKILIKGFIFSLSQLELPPRALLFFNSGVQLTIDGSGTVEDLKKLAARGTDIMVCGTCADYYSLKEQIAVGEITNMYGIVETMAGADNVINI